MPIEFRCNQCGKLLRTGDDTAGRQAQCPECGALSQIPNQSQSPGSRPPLAPLQDSFSHPAAGGSGPSSSWSHTSHAENPYGQPGQQAFFVSPIDRVSTPATALIITGGIGVLAQLIGILACLVQMTLGVHIAPQGPEAIPVVIGSGVNLLFGLIGLFACAVVIAGAMKMKSLENYKLAVAAAIIAVIPCTSPCCLLGVPFGIWALVVLNDITVKGAFRS